MNQRPLLPPRLRRGDTIGLFCPAGPVRNMRAFEDGVRLIRDFGFQVKVQGPVQANHPYLADDDRSRAGNLLALWADDTVQAVMAIRGGYGCLRLLPHLPLEALQRNPKLLVGFSDLTVLLNGLLNGANLATIHGPVVTSLARHDQESVHQLFALLSGEIPEYLQSRQLEILRGGTARGRLSGGNLTTLVHLLGTPWDGSWEKKILVLEDTAECGYRLDRMLTQLALSGRLEQLAGLILGTFDPGDDRQLECLRLQEQVWERVLELTQGLGLPIWGNFPLGHQQRNQALIMGMEATMDSSSGKLRLHPQSVQAL
ncbi:S66 peptidase family protein [Desulfogranum mediterraneum]|uniref:S66 peptidase family protein n=1 Tax=Desulfogranum mediterraneum TaxID=160661 RepID=UPI000490BF2E|nr:LD-carboxypeptidase [Desulfogranum mediterraneum]